MCATSAVIQVVFSLFFAMCTLLVVTGLYPVITDHYLNVPSVHVFDPLVFIPNFLLPGQRQVNGIQVPLLVESWTEEHLSKLCLVRHF
jgi:hypothetical protein